MRVLLIAVSVAAALAMPVASSAQSLGFDYGADVMTVTGSSIGQGTGIVIPLPCPPTTGECVNPWADQDQSHNEGSTDKLDFFSRSLRHKIGADRHNDIVSDLVQKHTNENSKNSFPKTHLLQIPLINLG